jgi:DHA2 family lincomycin resistance protein-like MFS transporter
MVTTLALYTQLTMTTPYWMILGLHAMLMISLAAIFTPVFTLSLGALPQSLYSHGSSMLSTLEQVAAAFGIALVITVMSARAGQLTGKGVDERVSLLDGMHWAFTVGTAIAVTAVVVAWLLPSRALR